MNSNIKTSVGAESQHAMTSSRKTALAAGVLYLLTFVSMPIGFLYSAILNDPNYIVSLFEFSLGVWLTVKGFNPSAITALYEKAQMNELIGAV
jgi:hypothetical protein